MNPLTQSSFSTKVVIGAMSILPIPLTRGAEAQEVAAAAPATVLTHSDVSFNEEAFSSSTAILCRRIEQGLLAYDEIPESQRHLPEVLVSCIKSDRCVGQTLRSIATGSYDTAVREQILTHITKRLSSSTFRAADADIPEGLFTEHEFISLVGPLVPIEPSLAQTRLLQSFAPTPEALAAVLHTRCAHSLVLLRALQGENVVAPLLPRLVSFVAAHPAEALKAVLESGSESVLAQPAMKAQVLAAVEQDPRVAPELHKLFPLGADRVAARDAVARYLAGPDATSGVARDIRGDLLNLSKYPKDILQAPEIRHAALERINWMLTYNCPLSEDLQHVRILVERFHDVLPDVVGLIRTPKELEVCADLLHDIALVNPRSNQHLGSRMDTLASDYLAGLAKVVQALEVLGIDGIGRFDNAREIIINRYHAGTAEERDRIDDLLGDNPLYTTGSLSLRSDPKADTRPLCVVTFCEPDTDFNDVFNAHELVGGRDDLDLLTTFYKVLYFEPDGADAAITEMVRVSHQLECPVEIWFCGAHGDHDGMRLSHSLRALASGQSDLSRGHEEALEPLKTVLAPNAKVPLLSCSIASSAHGEPSFAQILHRALPHVTVYGPDCNTNGRLLFHPNGMFKEIVFSRANRLAFLPHSASPTIEAGPYQYYDYLQYLRGWMETNPGVTSWMLGFSALFVVSLYDYLRGVRRLLRGRTQSASFENAAPAPQVEPSSDQRIPTETS